MKQRILMLSALLIMGVVGLHAQTLSSLKWGAVCSGRMGTTWYGSDEAKTVADKVLYVQRNNGGWYKNIEIHKMSQSELTQQYGDRYSHSCFDNAATTQEMRFLAKVWKGTGEEKYKTAFVKALNLIFKAEKGCGGWSQYYPLSGNGSYRDYITFNDDLTTNVMKILKDIHENNGDFKDIVSESHRAKCKAAFDRAIAMIIKCQVDDNGVKAAWCAQHDTITLYPAHGRPHELPSISGSESANLLSFLMTIENPSKALQECIKSAVAWLDAHKIPNKAIEEFKNASGENDKRVIDKQGSALWGRFIQLGGKSGETHYQAFFDKLKKYNRTRTYSTGGKTYSYTEYEIATKSYNPEKAYQPIYAIYDDNYQHLYYRFLYNFEDTENAVDWKGLSVVTSLNAIRRTSYQFLGNWCQNVIKSEYPMWLEKIKAAEEGVEYATYELSTTTYTESTEDNGITYKFSNGISVSNEKGKGYGAGKNNGIKYSAGVKYTISLPEGKALEKIRFQGYDNYDEDAYLSSVGSKTFGKTDYVFPGKVGGDATIVAHTIDLSDQPAKGSIDFSLGSKQCVLIITLYCRDSSTGIETVKTINVDNNVRKIVRDGQIIIVKEGKNYNTSGMQVK